MISCNVFDHTENTQSLKYRTECFTAESMLSRYALNQRSFQTITNHDIYLNELLCYIMLNVYIH